MCVYSCMQLLCVFSCWFLVLKVIEHIHPSLHGCYGNSKRKLNVKLYFEKTFNRPWTPSSDYTVLYTSLSYAPLPSESAAFLHFSFLGPEMWISSSQGLTNGTVFCCATSAPLWVYTCWSCGKMLYPASTHLFLWVFNSAAVSESLCHLVGGIQSWLGLLFSINLEGLNHTGLNSAEIHVAG